MALQLFNMNGLAWSDHANELAQESRDVLQPLVAKWTSMGYSIRDIAHIINWSVNDLEVDHVIDKQIKEGNNGK